MVRARHDRHLIQEEARLWAHVAGRPAAGTRLIQVPARRDERGRVTQMKRLATLTIRFSAVQAPPPVNDPRSSGDAPLPLLAVWAIEEHPPAGQEPLEWMLLTSEAVLTLEDAARVIDWYKRRWVIEEFHRALKEGCRLERSPLSAAADIMRLAAMLSVAAIRLLQLRDLADMGDLGDGGAGGIGAMKPIPPSQGLEHALAFSWDVAPGWQV